MGVRRIIRLARIQERYSRFYSPSFGSMLVHFFFVSISLIIRLCMANNRESKGLNGLTFLSQIPSCLSDFPSVRHSSSRFWMSFGYLISCRNPLVLEFPYRVLVLEHLIRFSRRLHAAPAFLSSLEAATRCGWYVTTYPLLRLYRL